MARQYDETAIVARVTDFSLAQKTALAMAIAQHMAPLYDRYAAIADSAQPDVLRRLLEDVWCAVRGEAVDIAPLLEPAEDLVPDEEPWSLEAGYAQNAAAALAYAIRTWVTSDPQEAAWATRQLFEAADLAAQQTPATADWAITSESALLTHPLVQEALEAIDDYLTLVETGAEPDLLLERAASVGQAWAGRLP